MFLKNSNTKIRAFFFHKAPMVIPAILLIAGIYLYSFPKPFFVQKKNVDQSGWNENDLLRFSFKPRRNRKYNIFLKFKHNNEYPYFNLFLNYKVIPGKFDDDNPDHSMTEINETVEYKILDEVTGKPLGKGIALDKSLYLLIAKNIEFNTDSEYSIQIKHMMRKANLIGIKQISIEIYEIKP